MGRRCFTLAARPWAKKCALGRKSVRNSNATQFHPSLKYPASSRNAFSLCVSLHAEARPTQQPGEAFSWSVHGTCKTCVFPLPVFSFWPERVQTLLVFGSFLVCRGVGFSEHMGEIFRRLRRAQESQQQYPITPPRSHCSSRRVLSSEEKQPFHGVLHQATILQPLRRTGPSGS